MKKETEPLAFDDLELSDESPTYTLTLKDWIRLFDGDELRALQHFVGWSDVVEPVEVDNGIDSTCRPGSSDCP